MSQKPSGKGRLASLSPTARTVLGIVVIAIVIVLGVKYGPHYADSNTATGDAPPPTVTVTSLQGALSLNRSMVYRGVTITVTSVEQAGLFSDDGKSAYAHVKNIIRLHLHVAAPSNQSTAIGIDYSNSAVLLLADGTVLKTGLAQISPDVVPGQNEDGFIDFWNNTPLRLSTLTFVIGESSLAFAQ